MRHLRRLANGVRKVAAGLTPFGESVWPGVRNDLFVAHQSIYDFLLRFSHEKDVLDAGCGTGYGSATLAHGGARFVHGVDRDRRSIRYATDHYSAPNLRFQVADCHDLDLPPASFDVIVASNLMEHLTAPERFLASVRSLLRTSGPVLLAVPPIWSSADQSNHRAIHYHRTNLSIDEWIGLFSDTGWKLAIYRHRYAGSAPIDFSSPYRSTLQASDFTFDPAGRDEVYQEPCISVVYRLDSA